MSSLSLALDASGGTHAPTEPVRAAAWISRETNLDIQLFGAHEDLARELDKLEHVPSRIHIRGVTPMLNKSGRVESARAALRRASVEAAAHAVGTGEAQALISAGRSREVVEAANRYIPLIPQVSTPALAAVYPTRERNFSNDRFALILDVGATVHCSAQELLFFAYMGRAYASRISKVPNPAVALLNMSEDEEAGDTILREAHRLMKEDERLNFIGNIGGASIPRGIADVVVCEGLVGNVTSKMATGLQDVMDSLGSWAFKQSFAWRMGLRLLAGGVTQLKGITDYHEYGGAPYLGFQRMVIKVHSQSQAKALTNAMKVAAKAVRDGVCEEIERVVGSFAPSRTSPSNEANA